MACGMLAFSTYQQWSKREKSQVGIMAAKTCWCNKWKETFFLSTCQQKDICHNLQVALIKKKKGINPNICICFAWECVAANHSKYSYYPMSIIERIFSDHTSVRIEHCINGRRLPGPVTHFILNKVVGKEMMTWRCTW